MFVRRCFGLALPHPAQIRKWYTKVSAEPGFSEIAFVGIKAKATSTQPHNNQSWDGTKYRGFVDLGVDNELDDSSPVAKEALVLMALGVNQSWKVPLGYFFVVGLSEEGRANIVKVYMVY